MTRNIRFLASWARGAGEPSILPGAAYVLAGWALVALVLVGVAQ